MGEWETFIRINVYDIAILLNLIIICIQRFRNVIRPLQSDCAFFSTKPIR